MMIWLYLEMETSGYNLILANDRKMLCISTAHIDTFIPRDRSLTTKYLSFKQPGSWKSLGLTLRQASIYLTEVLWEKIFFFLYFQEEKKMTSWHHDLPHIITWINSHIIIIIYFAITNKSFECVNKTAFINTTKKKYFFKKRLL